MLTFWGIEHYLKHLEVYNLEYVGKSIPNIEDQPRQDESMIAGKMPS